MPKTIDIFFKILTPDLAKITIAIKPRNAASIGAAPPANSPY